MQQAGQQPGQQPGANAQQPPYNQDFGKGRRFQEHKAQTAKKAATTEASPRSTASSAPGASSPPPSSFVDAPKQAASFRDVVSAPVVLLLTLTCSLELQSFTKSACPC